jgi:hypothetical protein
MQAIRCREEAAGEIEGTPQSNAKQFATPIWPLQKWMFRMTAIALEEGTGFDRQGPVHDIAVDIARPK